MVKERANRFEIRFARFRFKIECERVSRVVKERVMVSAGVLMVAHAVVPGVGRTLGALGLAMGQDGGGDDRLTVFVAIAAFSMLLQVLILMGVGIGVLVAIKKAMAEFTEIKGRLNPVIAKGQELAGKASELTTQLTPQIANITAKVSTIADHGVEISGTLKEKVDQFAPTLTKANETLLSANQTVMDATTKTHEQLLRVNEMVSQSLDATERAGKQMLHNVTQPGREIAGLATGVKVAVKTFFEKQGRPTTATTHIAEGYDVSEEAGYRPVDRSNDIGL